jgi:hypothetical protein
MGITIVLEALKAEVRNLTARVAQLENVVAEYQNAFSRGSLPPARSLMTLVRAPSFATADISSFATRNAPRATPDALQTHRDEQRAEGLRLREAIRRVIATNQGRRLSAKCVLYRLDFAALGLDERPSVRTIQRHMAAMGL